jgi:hypothetical protein
MGRRCSGKLIYAEDNLYYLDNNTNIYIMSILEHTLLNA